MDQIRIQKFNEVYNKFYCESWLARELDQFFTFKVPGYKFTPLYRAGVWDGSIHLFDQKNGLLYAGLLPYVEKFCQEREYEIEHLSDFSQDEFSLIEAKEFAKNLNVPDLEHREYQIEAFCHGVRNRRALLLSPTGSGKSFIIYLLVRYYMAKTLIIVPVVSLVHQMYSDFKSYGFDSEKYCQKIHDGKDTNKKIVITTWQSIYNQPKKWFDQFDVVIGDEAHLFKAKSLTKIMTTLTKCKYRFGFTGTLDGTATHKLVLEGLFGAVKRTTTTSELIENKVLSNFMIKCIVLKYTDEQCKLMQKIKYQDEIDFLVRSDKRNKFIKNLALSLKGNTLLLFQYVEKHGKALNKIISESVQEGRNVYFVHGQVESEDRENIRKLVEMENDAIIIASYGTFSTGINLKNLHNIIFASPTKSKIRNLQSIGRGLRLGKDKDMCVLYDISDNMQWKQHKNHTLKHFIERLKIYNEEKFETKIYTVKLQ